ncbi:MAG: hypothetical protein M1840_002133 [Geoglossum simile]|nr:MAG: hypothetical protein M1840_002133 [Geoglossum simile]
MVVPVGVGQLVGVGVKAVGVAIAVAGAPDDINVAFSLIGNANDSLQYAYKQRAKRSAALERDPDLSTRVDDVMKSTEDALHEIGLSVEDARVSLAEKSTVSLLARFKWVAADKDSFEKRVRNVELVHQTLLNIISSMEQLPVNEPETPRIIHAQRKDSFDELPMSVYQRNAKRLRSLEVPALDSSEPTDGYNASTPSSPTLQIKRWRAVSEPPEIIKAGAIDIGVAVGVKQPPSPTALSPWRRSVGEGFDLDEVLLARIRMSKSAEVLLEEEPRAKRKRKRTRHS